MQKQRIADPSDLVAHQTYRIFRDGNQVDRITLVDVDHENDIGYVAVGAYDALEEISLTEWLAHYTLVPEQSRISRPVR